MDSTRARVNSVALDALLFSCLVSCVLDGPSSSSASQSGSQSDNLLRSLNLATQRGRRSTTRHDTSKRDRSSSVASIAWVLTWRSLTHIRSLAFDFVLSAVEQLDALDDRTSTGGDNDIESRARSQRRTEHLDRDCKTRCTTAELHPWIRLTSLDTRTMDSLAHLSSEL